MVQLTVVECLLKHDFLVSHDVWWADKGDRPRPPARPVKLQHNTRGVGRPRGSVTAHRKSG